MTKPDCISTEYRCFPAMAGADRVSTGNLNLTPGWHEFELRISNGTGGSGPHTSPGFGYDPNGGTAGRTRRIRAMAVCSDPPLQGARLWWSPPSVPPTTPPAWPSPRTWWRPSAANIIIGTGNITVKNLTDGTQTTIVVTDTTQVSISGSVLTINPTANLLTGKNYAVQIDATAIDDTAGNSFAGIYQRHQLEFRHRCRHHRADGHQPQSRRRRHRSGRRREPRGDLQRAHRQRHRRHHDQEPERRRRRRLSRSPIPAKVSISGAS